jgi:hypothetical protein
MEQLRVGKWPQSGFGFVLRNLNYAHRPAAGLSEEDHRIDKS